MGHLIERISLGLSGCRKWKVASPISGVDVTPKKWSWYVPIIWILVLNLVWLVRTPPQFYVNERVRALSFLHPFADSPRSSIRGGFWSTKLLSIYQLLTGLVIGKLSRNVVLQVFQMPHELWKFHIEAWVPWQQKIPHYKDLDRKGTCIIMI